MMRKAMLAVPRAISRRAPRCARRHRPALGARRALSSQAAEVDARDAAAAVEKEGDVEGVVDHLDAPPAGGDPETSPKLEAIIDQIMGLNLVEFILFQKALMRRWGMNDEEAGMAMSSVWGAGGGVGGGGGGGAGGAGAGGDAAATAEPVEEKTHFTIKLAGFEAKSKIKIIKEVRSMTGLGLKEAKDLVESAPCSLKENVAKEEAEKIVEAIKALGGEAELA